MTNSQIQCEQKRIAHILQQKTLNKCAFSMLHMNDPRKIISKGEQLLYT